MSKPAPSPNCRAVRALLIPTGICAALYAAPMEQGLVDCHRRGFEIVWDPLPSGCRIDASKGLPTPRW